MKKGARRRSFIRPPSSPGCAKTAVISPPGGRDLLAAGTVLLRNWAVVQIVLCALTALWAYGSDAHSRHSAKVDDPAAGAKYRESFKDNLSRHRASILLKGVLVAAALMPLLVAIDSLGQTTYLIILTPGATVAGGWEEVVEKVLGER